MKDIAIFTMVKDEDFYLPIWYRYYSKFFDNIYILDHNSVDHIPDNILYPKAQIIKLDYEGFQDHKWMNDTVKDFQKQLLKNYKIVVFAEVDEIIVYTPDPSKLYSSILDMKGDSIKCIGFEPIHLQNEPNYEAKNYVIENRSIGAYMPEYNKTLISKVSLDWSLGFHHSFNKDIDEVPNTDYYLVHLHRINKDYHKKRKMKFSKMQMTKENPHWGWQNKLKTEEEIDRYYNRDCDSWTLIPEFLKNISL